MGTTAEKMIYLDTTKAQIKDGINRLGGELTNLSTFRSYAEALDDIYDILPKVTDEGSSLSLTPTRKGGLSIIPKGACEQDSTTGKNLCNARQSSFSFSANSNTDMKIISTEASSNVISLTANTKYYISYNIDNNITSNTRSTPHLILGSTSYYQYTTTNQNLTKGRKVWEFTAPTTGDYEVRYWVVDNSETLSVSDFMISTSSDTTFEPYTNGASPNPDYPQDIRVVTGDNSVVVSNKNLIFRTLNEATTISGNVVVTPNDDGSYTINGTSNTAYNLIIGYFYPVKDEYYTISGVENYTESNVWLSAISTAFPSGHVLSEYVNAGSNRRTRNAYTSEKTNVLLQVFNGAIYNNVKIYPMIEKNNAVTTFVKHEGTTTTLHLGTNYLAGIGDYKDEIVGKTDDWKIKRYTGKVVLNGSETWVYASNNKNFYINGTNYLPFNQGGKCYTTHFIGNAIDPNYNQDLHSFIGNSSFLTIKYFLYTNVNDFKNWLTTHNVTTYYILLVPVEETITDTQLIESLNNMYNLMGYDGQTNITISSNSANAQMIAQISALKGE